MPATEETFRSQRTLHIVFGVSSLLMAVVLFWMIMADHLRPWKNVQREFQKIETDKIKVAETEKIELLRETNQNRLDSIDAAMAAATARAEGNASAIRDLDAKIRNLEGRREKLDTERKFQKAELDSQISLYDGMIDRGELRQARNYITSTIRRSEANLRRVTLEFEAVKQELADARLRKNLLAANEAEVTTPPPPGTAAAKAGFQMGDVLSVPEFESLMQSAAEGKPAKVAVKRKDGQAASLTLEYAPVGGESDAPGEQLPIELAGVLVTPVTSEVLTTRREDLTRDRDRLARQLDQKNRQYGEGDLWNQVNAAFRGLPILDLAAPPTKIQQISLPDLFINYNFKQVPRYDRCTTCHQGIDRIGYDHTAADEPMPAVFRNHPKLTEGARAIDLKTGKEVDVGLYLDANGPHPINQFGCTICHAGQGSGTDFTFSSHEPNDLEQKEAWVHEYQWREMHHWDEKMLPTRFMQSSCLKCHHQVTDIPRSEAPKLLAGFDRIVKYGCTGCHAIGSPGSVGPSLTDNRPVGPNLRHVGSKVSAEWLAKWIRNPHAFRPDTRMPRFYDLTNNDHSVDQPKVEAEVHAMAHYLVQKSTPPPHFIENLPTPGDGAMGKELFLQKGCLACHAHSEFPPSSYPEAIQKYAKADFGPNLSNLAAKFPSPEHGTKWLANWIHAPEHYHAKTLMPNLQLSLEDSTHIAAWLVSLPASWPTPVELDAKDSPTVLEGLDSLVKLYISKSKVYNERTILLSEVDSTVASLSLDEKLMYLGEKTIGRLGCFGCHNIAGFETAKPIGTPLDGWGAKHPSKLDFAHITEYLDDHAQRTDEGVSYDGTDPYYQEKRVEHTRMGFLYQKLHRPRSYDYRKDRDDLKSWDDRLRMPQFTWANDPAAVEEVMTFILGLTGEFIPGKYLPNYGPEKLALAQGEKLPRSPHASVFDRRRYRSRQGLQGTRSGRPEAFRNQRHAVVSAPRDRLSELFPGSHLRPSQTARARAIAHRADRARRHARR
jgi:cbb3-type cytochrome oxidase cytochrome c subunit